ncbi:MAG: hypothetical protein AAFZ07_20105 [Actinomycetota bacterium]
MNERGEQFPRIFDPEAPTADAPRSSIDTQAAVLQLAVRVTALESQRQSMGASVGLGALLGFLIAVGGYALAAAMHALK